MKNGSPPTEANDRTGEETPPGMRFRARRKSAAERLPATLDFGLATLDSSERQRTIRQPFRGLARVVRSEEHTSELQSHHDLVCRLLLEKKKTIHRAHNDQHQHNQHHHNE